MKMEKENRQRQHYETIHKDYTDHYFDESSLEYRRRFILPRLVGGFDLNGIKVADLACGSGHNSLLLKEMFPKIKLEGFDISETACADYRVNVGALAHRVDLTAETENLGIFDAAVVIGGLHHCVSDLTAAIRNIASMLRPGGLFFLVEPNSRFFLQSMRSTWYKNDHWFDSATERAIDPLVLIRSVGTMFTEVRRFYFGGPAYFLILNSLVTRVPLSVKPRIAAPLFLIEKIWSALPGQAIFPAFGAVWKRN